MGYGNVLLSYAVLVAPLQAVLLELLHLLQAVVSVSKVHLYAQVPVLLNVLALILL